MQQKSQQVHTQAEKHKGKRCAAGKGANFGDRSNANWSREVVAATAKCNLATNQAANCNSHKKHFAILVVSIHAKFVSSKGMQFCLIV